MQTSNPNANVKVRHRFIDQGPVAILFVLSLDDFFHTPNYWEYFFFFNFFFSVCQKLSGILFGHIKNTKIFNDFFEGGSEILFSNQSKFSNTGYLLNHFKFSSEFFFQYEIRCDIQGWANSALTYKLCQKLFFFFLFLFTQ